MKKIITIIAALSLSAASIQASDFIILSEVLYDTPLQNRTDSHKHFGQFVELYNMSPETVNLSGWSLQIQETGASFTFPDVDFPGESFMIVAFGSRDDFLGITIHNASVDDIYTAFHIIYNIMPRQEYEQFLKEGDTEETIIGWGYIIERNLILFQNSMPLPFGGATLLLKDNSGITRDSVRYTNIWISSAGGYPAAINPHRTNCPTEFNSGKFITSIQRINVTFNSAGRVNNGIWLSGGGNSEGLFDLNEEEYRSPMLSHFPIATYTAQPLPPITINNYIIMASPLVAMNSIPLNENGRMILDDLPALVTINYFDGLGRPYQTVRRAFTPLGDNLATLTEHDSFGRVIRSWLPTPVDAGIDYMPWVAFTLRSKDQYKDDRPFTENIYSEIRFANSEVYRDELVAVQAPGADMNNRRTGRAVNANQNQASTIRRFRVNNTSNQLYNAGFHNEKALISEQTTDEDGRVHITFTDNFGRTIMTRQRNWSQNHDTYYVYNDLGQLAYMLPPMASAALANRPKGDDICSEETIMQQFAFVYKYDSRGNQTAKRLPGADWVYYVFDGANRPVLRQDGNMRANNQWKVMKYDRLGRLIYTGIINREIAAAEKTMLNNTVVVEYFDGSCYDGKGYTNSYFGNIEILTVNHYDCYSVIAVVPHNNMRFQPKNGYGTAFSTFPLENNNRNGNKGLLTATAVRVLGTNEFLWTLFYYDYRGRVIQTRSNNHVGGFDIVYKAYDFAGNITKKLSEHSTNPQHSNPLTELYTFTYDHAGRLIDTFYTLVENPDWEGISVVDAEPILLSRNVYDEIGRLKRRYRHNETDIETFEYNIRNWITQIQSGDFVQRLYYNNPPARFHGTPQFAGNISAVSWTFGNVINGHRFIYDGLNRLISSYGLVNNQLCDWSMQESFSYDMNGNIMHLRRTGMNDIHDDLFMIYQGNQLMRVYDWGGSQNRHNVMEYHDRNRTGDDFAYDANGNMIKDLDRDIVTIQYNFLNLPELIQFSNGNRIMNTYAADGRKLRTEFHTARIPFTTPLATGKVQELAPSNRWVSGTIYAGHIEYRFGDFIYDIQLDRAHNAEGFVMFEPPCCTLRFAPRFNYFRRDHLGNVREVWHASVNAYCVATGNFAGQGGNFTTQRTQFMPSGVPWETSYGSRHVNNRLHNSTELIEMHGYNSSDHGWRRLHHAINRYVTMDRLAEQFPWQSPYVHANNNPIFYVDIEGDRGHPAEDAVFDPQTGRMISGPTTAIGTTYIPMQPPAQSIEMTREQVAQHDRERAQNRYHGTIRQGQSNYERFLHTISSPTDRAIVQNPLVQATVVGVTGKALLPTAKAVGNFIFTSNLCTMGAGAVDGVFRGWHEVPAGTPHIVPFINYVVPSETVSGFIYMWRNREWNRPIEEEQR